MATLARHEFQLQDAFGNILTTASVAVTREGGGLEPLFSDRAGAVPISNPIAVNDAGGVVAFHCKGGAFQIVVTSGAFTRTLRYVAIGTMSESDTPSVPASIPPLWAFNATTSDADPGSGVFRLNNASAALATQAFIDNLAQGGADLSAWLDTLDNFGDSAGRGYLTIFDASNPTTIFRIYLVTGTVVDGTGYRKVSLTHLTGSGSFTAATAYLLQFTPRGPTGTGDVTGPGSAVVGNAAIFNNVNGKVIADAGAGPMLQGKHTIWVPAAAMTPRTTNGAASVTTETATNRVMNRTLDFDQTTQEFAQFTVAPPKSWNEGTVTFQPVWTAAAGTGTVAWRLAGLARSDDDAIDTAFGTAQSSSDTLLATGDVHIGPESAAITIGGTPAENDLLYFQLDRDVANDTLTADAKLIGIRLYLTINAGNDA
jgi:hypothetical protein